MAEYEKEIEHTPPTDAIVVHAVNTRHWIADLTRRFTTANKGLAISGIRWLLGAYRRAGKIHSSVVLYLSHTTDHRQTRTPHPNYIRSS